MTNESVSSLFFLAKETKKNLKEGRINKEEASLIFNNILNSLHKLDDEFYSESLKSLIYSLLE